ENHASCGKLRTQAVLRCGLRMLSRNCLGLVCGRVECKTSFGQGLWSDRVAAGTANGRLHLVTTECRRRHSRRTWRDYGESRLEHGLCADRSCGCVRGHKKS